MIRIIIVDDEILARIGIQSFVEGEPDIAVSGTFAVAEDAVEFLKSNRVDIVITDIEMADMNGLQLIQIIRENNLADGVIIISCHDNFAYAQEAISRGTDSYVLKHNISKKILLEEIHKVYEKTHKLASETISHDAGKKLFSNTADIEGNGIYRLGVLRVKSGETVYSDKEAHMEGAMLVHLLEEIVSRYKMGTLFAPYNRDIFVIFRFGEELTEEERKRATEDKISAIDRNMRQYMNNELIYGLSREFDNLQDTKKKYEEAVLAADLSFYESEKNIFYFRKEQSRETEVYPHFSAKSFLDNDGIEIFESELQAVLRKASFHKTDVNSLKEQMIQNINILTYQILKEYGFSDELMRRYHMDAAFISAVTMASDVQILGEKLLEAVRQFRKELILELEKDDLSQVFSYIEKHLTEKISLAELAEQSCMSVPSFCKKFKERTGTTLVQYMNEKRIEKAKILMKNRNYSLWQISEMTGFSNANYLIRVFKKITGQTASEYRSQFGITDEE